MSTTSSLPKTTSTPVQVSSTSSDSQPKKKLKVDSSPDISANASQPTISGDISETLALFECCVCLEHITPPILQCRNSHVFCQSCREKFKSPVKCPTCRVPIPRTESRNHSLEQIAQSLRLPFPCKYKTNGCDMTSLLTEKVQHEKLCGYGPYCCPHVFKECKWLGSREEVTQHLEDKHKYPIEESYFEDWVLSLDYKAESQTWRKIFSFNDQKFIFIRKFDSTRKCQFKAIVLFIGEQRDANQFKYKIDLRNKSNGTRLRWEDKPISIKNDINSLLSFFEGYGLNLNEYQINRFWCNNKFKVRLDIVNDV